MVDAGDEAPPSEEWLRSAAEQALADAFDSVTSELIGLLRAVGHNLARRPEALVGPLSAVYVAPSGEPSLVGFDVIVSAFSFADSELRPSDLTRPPDSAIAWEAYSAAAFGQAATTDLGLKLQRVLEVEMLRRFWDAAHEVAESHDVPGDSFAEVDISEDDSSSLDFCAFRRRLHLGFSFIATVGKEPSR